MQDRLKYGEKRAIATKQRSGVPMKIFQDIAVIAGCSLSFKALWKQRTNNLLTIKEASELKEIMFSNNFLAIVVEG